MVESSEGLSSVKERYRAELFGTFRFDPVDASTLPSFRRKTQAILAYLLLSGGREIPRNTFFRLLWGDRGEEQARSSLRQALYELRPLSAAILTIDRTTVRLDLTTVTTDLDRYRALCAQGDPAAIANHLAKQPDELLAGFGPIADGFDAWLSDERQQRREECRRLALDVARKALALGEFQAADVIASGTLVSAPSDRRAAGIAAEAQSRLRDGARGQYETARSGEALGNPEVSLRHPAIRQLLPKDDTPATTSAVDLAAIASAHRLKWPIVAGAAGLLGLVALGIGVGASRLASGDGPKVLVVEPTTGQNGDTVAATLNSGLAADISRMIVGNANKLNVVSGGSQVPAASAYSITSEARTANGVVYASISLVDRASQAILWSRNFSRPASELDGLRDQLAMHVADVAVCGLGGRPPRSGKLDTDTMRLYLEACEEKHGNWANAAKLLTKVVARRPDFAHAWAMLAASTVSYADLLPGDAEAPLLKQGAAYAQRALALDPTDGEAYIGLAFSKPKLADWAYRDRILSKARAVDPDNSVLYVEAAYDMSLVGRRNEGARFASIGHELDLFNYWGFRILARYQGDGGQIEDADGLYDAMEHLWPKHPLTAEDRFRFTAIAGDPVKAMAMLNDPAGALVVPSDRRPYWEALLTARIKESADAKQKALQLFQADSTPFDDAVGFVLLGRVDQAFAKLDMVKFDNSSLPVLFSNAMAPLRADPRFMAFAARIGLLRIWRQTGVWPDFCRQPGLPYDCAKVAASLKA